TALSLLVVWGALVAPDNPFHFGPSAFLRLPLEGLVLIALAIVLPVTGRRVLAAVVGPVLALVILLKVLDIGFFVTFDRPFDPYQDLSYAGIGSETLSKTVGASSATLVVVAVAVLTVALFVLVTLAVFRLTRVAAGHRRWSLRAGGRRHQLAGALHAAVRPVGQHRRSLQPARRFQSFHAQRRVQAGRMADRRRRAVE